MSTELTAVIVASIAVIPTVITLLANGRKKKIDQMYDELKKCNNDIKRANTFQMKMLFEIIDIMDGKKINGQVKALRKEAEQYNIDH